jgi:hypothetical protein
VAALIPSLVCGVSVGKAKFEGTENIDATADIEEFATFQGFEVYLSRKGEITMGSREELIQRSISFLREVKDMTPGVEMERWLNETYGENSALYQDLARLIKIGIEEGWAANQEVDGPNYRGAAAFSSRPPKRSNSASPLFT